MTSLYFNMVTVYHSELSTLHQNRFLFVERDSETSSKKEDELHTSRGQSVAQRRNKILSNPLALGCPANLD